MTKNPMLWLVHSFTTMQPRSIIQPQLTVMRYDSKIVGVWQQICSMSGLVQPKSIIYQNQITTCNSVKSKMRELRLTMLFSRDAPAARIKKQKSGTDSHKKYLFLPQTYRNTVLILMLKSKLLITNKKKKIIWNYCFQPRPRKLRRM